MLVRTVHLTGCVMMMCAGARAEMRLASLNLDKKYGPELIANIAKVPELRQADILLLQEVVDGPKFHTPSAVAAALGMHFLFAPAFRLNADFEEGLAILSRYELSSRSVIPLTHNSLHFHTRIRIALAATVSAPQGPLRVMDLHLDNRINAAEKKAQLDGIWDEPHRVPGPYVIGGDFNTGNFHWTSHVLPVPGVQSLSAMVREEMQQRGFTTPLGSGAGTLRLLNIKLDWIYARGLQAKGSGVTPITFSDHNSVWVKYEMSEERSNGPKYRGSL